MDSRKAEPFARRLVVFAGLSLLLTLLFGITYGGTNALAAQRPGWFRLYSEAELRIPFVPPWIYVYLSFNLFTLTTLFTLDIAGLKRYAAAFALVTLGAAACHLLLPTASGWERPNTVPGYPAFGMLYRVEGPHNLVPSLHVAYSWLTALVIRRRFGWIWAALLSLSTLLVHQHHLIDLPAGWLLGWLGYRWYARGR